MFHHTKSKGDKGLGFVIADILRQDCQPAILLSEHLPFDCIAIDPSGQMARLSVRYRAARGGQIRVEVDSNWSDKNGIHKKPFDAGSVDGMAVYCPDTSQVYYLPSSELSTIKRNITLRLTPTKNNQVDGIRLANDYVDIIKVFKTNMLP